MVAGVERGKGGSLEFRGKVYVDRLYARCYRGVSTHGGLVLAIYTRFGTPVEIRYRCDDFDEMNDDGTLFVHVWDLEEPNADPMVVPTWELRAEGGINAIMEAANAAPIAHCTGKHEGRVAMNAIQRAAARDR